MPSDMNPKPGSDVVSACRSRSVVVRQWLSAGTVIVLCCIPFLRSYEQRDRPLGEDEIYWIGQAYYFHLAFEQREWSHPDWQLLPARENPVLGKYVIGLGLRLNGLSVTKPDWLGVFYLIARDRPGAWGNERDRQERQTVVDRMEPTTRELALAQDRFEYPTEFATVGRAIMLVFGMCAIALVFVLGALYASRPAAFLAALLFSLHPAVVCAYTEVGVDILAIAFSLLAVVHFVWIERRIWRRCSQPRACRVAVCVTGGLSLALAIGSKINSVAVGFLGATMGMYLAISFLRRRRDESRNSCQAMAFLLVLSLVAFVGLNPLTYPNPARGVWTVYADQQRSLEVQKGIPTQRQPLHSWSNRIGALADLTALHPAVSCLVLGAFLFHVLEARRAGKAPSVIALWWLIAVATVSAWLPFARPRYALPVIAPSVIMVCVAGNRLVEWARRRSPA